MSLQAMDDPVRLPRHATPTHYDLHLTADPAHPTFSGRLAVTLAVREATSDVVLNAKGLVVASARVGSASATVTHDEATERVRMHFASRLTPGTHRLDLEYSGTVSQGMAGLYLSKDGDELCLATQCEATDARAILPCFDEPDCKATFQWTVTAPTGLQVLTNGRLRSRTDGGATATWAFEPTPAMSSYLVAVAIGAFKAGRPADARKVPFQVWALGGKQGLGDEARDFSARLLPWYEDYFGQPYAFGKYDQVAVPSFAFGAMENPGLVVFRPSLLLLDPATASWDDRKHVALVVAHEFAHMWFGNLVTMAWWDDLWLNEAFAEWMAHRAVHDLAPDLDVWVQFQARASGAMATDTLDSTHAIYHPIRTPHEAAEMFDAITYGKGSATMRMVEAFLGPDQFRAGLRTYMQQFRFGNAKGADLWNHLGKASGADVAAILRDWIERPGHPQVAARWDAKTQTLHLNQSRARASPASTGAAPPWRIPMVLRYRDDAGVHVLRHLMSGREDAVKLPVQGQLRWLWPNADDVGFYQCVPDHGLRTLALAAAQAGDLASSERVAMLRDLMLDLRAGGLDARDLVAALPHLVDPRATYDVLQRIAGLLREVERLLELSGDADATARFRTWVGDRLRDEAARAKPSGDPRDAERRAALLRCVAGIARDKAAVAQARTLAAQERKAPADVDATVAGVAVAVEAITGDRRTLATHLETYQVRRDAKSSPQEVERYLYVLPAFREPELVDAVLGTLSTGVVAPQAVGPILRAMLMEPHSQRAAWAFTKANWEMVRTRLGEAWVANLVEACGELPEDLAGDVRSFFAANLGGMAKQAWLRAQELLVQRAEYRRRVTPALAAWAKAL